MLGHTQGRSAELTVPEHLCLFLGTAYICLAAIVREDDFLGLAAMVFEGDV